MRSKRKGTNTDLEKWYVIASTNRIIICYWRIRQQRKELLMAKGAVKETIHAKGIDIGIYTTDFQNEYISLTDIAKYKSDEPNDVIRNWLRSRDTFEFLGLWESLHNSDFKPVEFDEFRNQAGLNAFTLSPSKWIGYCF